MHLALYYAESYMTVNIPVQERNVGTLLAREFYTLLHKPLKTIYFASQDGGIATVARMQSHNCTYKYILF